MPPQKPNNTKLKVTSAIVVTVAVVMLVIANTVTKAQQPTQSAVMSSPTTTSSTTPSTTATTPTTSTPTTTTTSSTYKDGTYSATSSYYVPHGTEEIQVSLTIKNGVVTDSNITNSENDRESAQFQESFASEYKSQVVGKNISGLNLSYIAGASDTTQGFNDAVTKIQSEAQA